MLCRDHDVSLLEAVGSNKGVNSGDLDAIEILASFLDHRLVGSSVNDEHQCIVVFNGLDGALSAQWVLDDGVLVPGWLQLDASSSVLGGTGESESLGSSEGGVGPNLVLSDTVASLLNSGGGSLGLRLKKVTVRISLIKIRAICQNQQAALLTPFFGIVEFLFN